MLGLIQVAGSPFKALKCHLLTSVLLFHLQKLTRVLTKNIWLGIGFWTNRRFPVTFQYKKFWQHNIVDLNIPLLVMTNLPISLVYPYQKIFITVINYSISLTIVSSENCTWHNFKTSNFRTGDREELDFNMIWRIQICIHIIPLLLLAK